MKKRGFTLAEVIVAMSIIGVIAAITMPMLGNIIPDKNKIKALTTYKIIQDITAELLSSPSIYRKHRCNFNEFNANGANYICMGLGDITQPFVEPYNQSNDANKYSGKNKYTNLLISKLDVVDQDSDSTDGAVTFTTRDKMFWKVHSPEVVCNNDSVRGYRVCGLNYIIAVFVDEDSVSADSTQENSTNTDMFSFKVNNDGTVYGHNKLTKQYIISADKISNKKEDYSKAGVNN